MKNLDLEIKNHKLMEALVDISYNAGFYKHTSGNSREDVLNFIFWAKEFEQLHANTDWHEEDYIIAIDKFTEQKLSNQNFTH